MESREEALTRRERAELEGYVSWGTTLGRAVLFVVAISAVAWLSWRIQQGLSANGALWLVPTLVAAVALFVRAKRWTGGRELRDRIVADLRANRARVYHIRVADALVFDEQEDEGPVVFVLTDAGETLVFVGQDLARHVGRGFPWREFEVRESVASRRFLGLKRAGEPQRIPRRPPLSPEQYRELDLGAVSYWKQLDVPFDRLRHL